MVKGRVKLSIIDVEYGFRFDFFVHFILTHVNHPDGETAEGVIEAILEPTEINFEFV